MIKYAVTNDVIIYAITNDVIKYAITNDLIKYAITNDVINKKINNNFVFPNTPCATHARLYVLVTLLVKIYVMIILIKSTRTIKI